MSYTKTILAIVATLIMTVLGHSQIMVNCDDFGQEIYGDYIITITKENNFYSYGVINLKGEIVLENKYKSSYTQKATISDDVFYAIDPTTNSGVLIDLKTKLPFINEKIKKFSGFKNGNAIVRTSSSCYYINRAGKKIVSVPENTEYDIKKHGLFQNGLARISFRDVIIGPMSSYKKNYYSYINRNGERLNNEEYVSCGDFYDGLARVCNYIEGKYQWGYIDTLGEIAIDYKFSNVPSAFSDGMAVVQSMDKNYGFINMKGEIIIEASYRYASGFYKGVCLVKDQQNILKIINKQNQTLWTFNDVRRFLFNDYSEQQIKIMKLYVNEGLLLVDHSKFRKNVIIDSKGNLVLNSSHTIGGFSNGLSYAIIIDKETSEYQKGIINKKGEFILKCKKQTSY